MYNLAKISSKRVAPIEPNIQYRVAVINTAMHYMNLQLISVFIYYTFKNQGTKHSASLNSNINLFQIFICFFILLGIFKSFC